VNVSRVSVVIPNYNGRRWLPGLLGSLHHQSEPAGEVIIVDNASADGSLEWLAGAHPDVRVIALGANTGFAHAANRGIAAARGELVALLNPDVELDPDWLARMAARFADPGIAAAACKMISLADPREVYDAGDVMRRDGVCMQRGRGYRDDGRFDTPGEVIAACAGAALYRRAALEAVGGFDEGYFMYLEDVDLGLALRGAGWRCAYEPVIARHAGEGSSPHAGAHHRWVARNTVLLIAKWFPPGWLGAVAYRQAALLALAARERRLRVHLAGLAAGLTLAPGVVRRRPATRVAIGVVIPAQPIRGPLAEGHPTQVAASWAGHNRTP
jgi:GT2 family glycosyltransferase